MNITFGGQLRKELVELIHRPELLRKRAQSTGSQRLSSDSTERNNDDPPAPDPFLDGGGYKGKSM